MSSELVISFGADAVARTIYTDDFPLHELGALSVERASTVEYNNTTKQWEVKWAGSDAVAFTSLSRQRCLDWERRQLLEQLKGM